MTFPRRRTPAPSRSASLNRRTAGLPPRALLAPRRTPVPPESGPGVGRQLAEGDRPRREAQPAHRILGGADRGSVPVGRPATPQVHPPLQRRGEDECGAKVPATASPRHRVHGIGGGERVGIRGGNRQGDLERTQPLGGDAGRREAKLMRRMPGHIDEGGVWLRDSRAICTCRLRTSGSCSHSSPYHGRAAGPAYSRRRALDCHSSVGTIGAGPNVPLKTRSQDTRSVALCGHARHSRAA